MIQAGIIDTKLEEKGTSDRATLAKLIRTGREKGKHSGIK
jgi:hypothetical protein